MAKSSIQNAFQMPVPVKILGRTSSITNSFVNGIIPVIQPTDAEIIEALTLLDMTPETKCCAYCGDDSTEWDHLLPIVKDRRPTGQISQIRNLVPACGKCNQSKGNKAWRDWMLGPAKRSPKTRGISDLAERIARLETFEAWGQTKPMDIAVIVGAENWDAHWRNLDAIVSRMREAQAHAEILRVRLKSELGEG